MEVIRCPTCRQNMSEPPHAGLRERDCPQCGQGIMWRFALKVKRRKQKRGRAALAAQEAQT